MIRMVLSRLAQAPLILLAVYTITLALAWLIPGNPIDNPEGRRPPPEVIEQINERYNLDSFPAFYFGYLDRASGLSWARGAMAGEARGPVFDLGPSLQYSDWSVTEIVAGSLPVSVVLGGSAIFLALGLGVGAGVAGSIRPGSIVDTATLAVALAGISMPSFLVGTLLLAGLGVALPVFPVAEWGTARSLALPAVTLSLPFAAYIARLTRLGMIDALNGDAVRTARAKGLRERSVVLKHALRQALLPVVSYLGPAAAYAMTGSFVVERVFRVPGIGQHFVNAVQNKDLFLITSVTLVFASILILFNLAVDVAYRWVDPRIGSA